MGQVIKTWVDLLCSQCYSIIRTGIPSDEYDKWLREGDDIVYCGKCGDYVFPIDIMKREYDNRNLPSKGAQAIQRDIEHGVEILHIGGNGITHNLEPSPTGTTSKTYHYNLNF